MLYMIICSNERTYTTHHECGDISSLLPASTMVIEGAHGGHTAPAQGGPSTANTHPTRGGHSHNNSVHSMCTSS